MLLSITPSIQEPTSEYVINGTERLDEWLSRSLDGDVTSRDKMLVWVHTSALEYYLGKVHVEPLLSKSDAWDMASESVVEFERSWSRVRKVAHYCRRMFKNNLSRFLRKKRKSMHREQELSVPDLDTLSVSVTGFYPVFEFDAFTDDQLDQLRIARRELDMADDIVRCLFEYRVFAGCLTYAEIGEILGTSETSLRMRMTRFNRRVRSRYEDRHRVNLPLDRFPKARAKINSESGGTAGS
ncbi:MAG: sigma-70 family RNA polymerase sigma factor [Bacteroidetes bacterium]|nr:MAG: sigma-70 family RNA polymerase sigma factor [Bacteroidota bacterium]